MAKQQSKSKPPAPLTPYQMMGVRIQKIINSPSAQKDKSVLIAQEPHESSQDWERFLDEVAENDNVALDHRLDGSVMLSWAVPVDD